MGCYHVTISLFQVRDMDCLVSLSPIAFDLPSPYREAVGPDAILRRILYKWCRDISTPLLDLEGWRPGPRDLRQLKQELESAARLAGDGDFILGASVDVLYDTESGRLQPKGRIQLVDGLSYALEVTTGDAPAALLALGAA
jgi:hypothetical protein